MAKQPQNAISPTREEDYPEWYQQVVRAGDLAETSPVRGCMVIRPWGYSLWENIQRVLDGSQFVLGREVEAFETAFATYLGVPHCVAVNSGTDALAIALRALRVGAGDEVITVAHTAVATVAAIALTGATPVLIAVLT